MTRSTRFITGLLAGLAVLSAASAARAQFVRGAGAAEGQVAASGHVHLQRLPTHLRMYLQVTGKGKTLEEALAALRERREAVAAQLEKLGVDKKDLVFTAPGVDDSAAARQRQMETMIAQRMGRGAKKAAKPAKPPVAVAAMLTATWPLAGDSAEKLLLAADALREKVKAAELGGGKETPKLSPEEQEVAEEMAAEIARSSASDEEQAKPGEPHFFFLARLSPQDRQAVLAGAFAKAKAQAAELAQAAGAGLGAMTALGGEASGGMGSMGSGVYPSWRYNRYGRSEAEYLQEIVQNAAGDQQQAEAMAPRPDGIAFDFAVHATFALEPAKPQK